MSNSGGTVAVLAYDPGTKVYPLLGFSHPADPRSDTITVQQLLDHQGGYDDGTNPNYPGALDPTYSMRTIGQALGHVVASKRDIASYMYGLKLQFSPGTDSAYSNYGYLLLGAVVEKVTGMSFHAYLAQAVLQPAGISEVEVFPTRAAGRTAHQAIAEDPYLGQDPLDLASTLNIPAVYGGDGEINEIGDPNDGTGASAEAMAQFIHTHAVWGNGGRAPAPHEPAARPAPPRGPSRAGTVSTGPTRSTRATGRRPTVRPRPRPPRAIRRCRRLRSRSRWGTAERPASSPRAICSWTPSATEPSSSPTRASMPRRTRSRAARRLPPPARPATTPV